MKNLVDLKNKIKVGFIINPVAGMGGSVGLKGTDGKVREALLRGSVPHAGERAKIAMEELLPLKASLEILTYGGKMGGEIAKAMGFDCRLLGEDKEEFSALDTLELCKKLKAENVKLLLFAGGDGTARDVYNGVGTSVIALGIPAGVKIHSPVYAKSPKTAGALAALYLSGKEKETKEEEVLDIDEEKYRNNMLSTTLYGYLTIPYKKNYTQNRKTATPITEKNAIRSIGMKIVSEMEEGTYYLIGAGTTTAGIMEELGLKNTLIGVDLVLNKQLLGNDLYGEQIMQHIRGKKAKLVITITGGQGFLFGRGNQQITPEVIKAVGKENIIIVATGEKLSALRGASLLTDTGDRELDKLLKGYYKVIAGYHDTIISPVAPCEE